MINSDSILVLSMASPSISMCLLVFVLSMAQKWSHELATWGRVILEWAQDVFIQFKAALCLMNHLSNWRSIIRPWKVLSHLWVRERCSRYLVLKDSTQSYVCSLLFCGLINSGNTDDHAESKQENVSKHTRVWFCRSYSAHVPNYEAA